MRFLNGVLVGIVLTIGLAYLHDRNVPEATEGSHHELVNWDEFGHSLGEATDWLQGQFNRLRKP